MVWIFSINQCLNKLKWYSQITNIPVICSPHFYLGIFSGHHAPGTLLKILLLLLKNSYPTNVHTINYFGPQFSYAGPQGWCLLGGHYLKNSTYTMYPTIVNHIRPILSDIFWVNLCIALSGLPLPNFIVVSYCSYEYLLIPSHNVMKGPIKGHHQDYCELIHGLRLNTLCLIFSTGVLAHLRKREPYVLTQFITTLGPLLTTSLPNPLYIT